MSDSISTENTTQDENKMPTARQALAESMKVIEKTQEFKNVTALIRQAMEKGETVVSGFGRLPFGLETYLEYLGYNVSNNSAFKISWSHLTHSCICQH